MYPSTISRIVKDDQLYSPLASSSLCWTTVQQHSSSIKSKLEAMYFGDTGNPFHLDTLPEVT
jgi:hypothetical protein